MNESEKKQTEYQWNKKGYVLNEGAVGSRDINPYNRLIIIKYTSSEVHEDKEKAKENAIWFNGNNLNKRYSDYCSWSFGSDYLYCFIDDTHDPKEQQELIEALRACECSYLKRSCHEI